MSENKLKFNFDIEEINKALSPSTNLRSFNKIPFNITKLFQRNVLELEKIAKKFKEVVEVLQKRIDEEIVFINNVPSDRKKFAEFKTEMDAMNKEKHVIELYVFSSKDFPTESTDFGEKEVTLSNGNTMKISYLDEYLKLLDFLIIEKDDYENFVVRQRQLESAKPELKAVTNVGQKQD